MSFVAEQVESLDVERIFITRTEGDAYQAYVGSISSAEKVLVKWSSTLPRGSKDRALVKLIFEDGVHFSSYVLLTGSKKRISLVRHLRTQMRKYFSGSKEGIHKGLKQGKVCMFEGLDENDDKELLLFRYAV